MPFQAYVGPSVMVAAIAKDMVCGSKTHSNENEDEKEACKRAHAIKSSFNWVAHTAATHILLSIW